VPIVMLFGIGNVPAVMATIIVALPPMVRLTNLGIREVRADVVEAGNAFGCTRWQVLREIQLPLAMPTLMAGLNQALMLSLSMVVIAALIGAGGLGLTVYQGINRLNVGLAGIAGLAIVLLAITLDRITQGRQPHRDQR
jgi:glycine betaine/proline transport system permease protein